MHVPGLTTTRLHLVLAVLCAASLTATGLAAAAAILGVAGLRLLAQHHQGLQGAHQGATSTWTWSRCSSTAATDLDRPRVSTS
jgi:hypothetical protein